jgi:hypothetical protein
MGVVQSEGKQLANPHGQQHTPKGRKPSVLHMFVNEQFRAIEKQLASASRTR